MRTSASQITWCSLRKWAIKTPDERLAMPLKKLLAPLTILSAFPRCVCVCVCVRKRERERARERERERESKRERDLVCVRIYVCMHVCVCVCVLARKRMRVRVCVCVCIHVCVYNTILKTQLAVLKNLPAFGRDCSSTTSTTRSIRRRARGQR